MKTLNRFLVLGLFAVLSTGAFGCGKKKSSNQVNATVPGAYYLQNGVCYQNGGVQVAVTYCNNLNGQYGQPGYTQPGYGQPGYTQPVYGQPGYNNTYYGYPTYGYPNSGAGGYVGGSISGSIGGGISGSIGIGYGAGQGRQCYGYYYTQSGQSGYCNGANCSGYTLYQYGQAVYCY